MVGARAASLLSGCPPRSDGEGPGADAGQSFLRRRTCCVASCLLLGCSPPLLTWASDAVLRGGDSLRAPHENVHGDSNIQALLNVNRSIPRLKPLTSSYTYPAWTMSIFPDPKINPGACGLMEPGLICDPDHLLPNSSRFAIEDRLQRLRDDLAYVLGVAVMDRLDVSTLLPLPYWRHDEAVVDVFAKSLLRRWSLGDDSNGVMLVVVRDPDYVSIYAQRKAVKRGLDPVLCRGIADYGVLPYVDNGYLDRGIVSGVEEIAVALRHPPEPMRPWPLSDKLFALCCLVTCLASVVCVCGCCCRSEDDREEPSAAPHRPCPPEVDDLRSLAVGPGRPQQHSLAAPVASAATGGPGNSGSRHPRAPEL